MEELVHLLQQSDQTVIVKGNGNYDLARRCWNGLVDRYPLCIVEAESKQQISDCLRVCYNAKQKLTIRGGGHNVAGSSIENGAVLLDLSKNIRGVSYNSENNQILVKGGSLWSDVDEECSKYGRSVPCGLISHTGVAGLTLGGGIGWMSRKHGLSCDSLVGIDLITCEGSFVHADDTENQDLFWAVKGGGGNFGVVETFYFNTYEVPQCNVHEWFFPGGQHSSVFSIYTQLCNQLPNSATCYAFISKPGILLNLVDIGNTVGEDSLIPLYRHEQLNFSSCSESSIKALNSRYDSGNPHGDYYYWSKSIYLHYLDDPLQTDFPGFFSAFYNLVHLPTQAHFESIPELGFNIEIVQMQGKLKEIPVDSAAFYHRSACFEIHCIFFGRPADVNYSKATALQKLSGASARYHKCIEDNSKEFSKFCTIRGGYVNTDNLLDASVSSEISFYGEHLAKLREVKYKYDKTNFFSNNHNIKPANLDSVVNYTITNPPASCDLL